MTKDERTIQLLTLFITSSREVDTLTRLWEETPEKNEIFAANEKILRMLLHASLGHEATHDEMQSVGFAHGLAEKSELALFKEAVRLGATDEELDLLLEWFGRVSVDGIEEPCPGVRGQKLAV